MKKKKIAKSMEELDRRFDDGEDIHDIIDMSKAKIIRYGKSTRINVKKKMIFVLDNTPPFRSRPVFFTSTNRAEQLQF